MSICKLSLTSAAGAVALVIYAAPAFGQYVAKDPPPPPSPAPTAAPSPPPAAKPKPRLAPKPVPVPAPVPVPVKPNAAPSASDEAKRLQRIEDALYHAGLLEGPSDSPAQQRAQVQLELTKLEQQRQNLEAAVKGGLDAESVKPALEKLRKASEELTLRLAALDAEQPAPGPVAKSALALRLDALEASLAALAQPRENPAQTNAQAIQLSPGATPGEQPAAPTSPIASEGKAGWKDGFFIESSDQNYALRIFGFLDFKFAYQALAGQRDEFAFSVPFARLGIKGNLFAKPFKYLFITELGKGSAQLLYYFADYTFAKDYLALRVGQQKRPFSRLFGVLLEKNQFITSSTVTLKAFGDGNDLGIVVHNNQPTFEYSVGIFNGTTSKSNFSGNAVVNPATGMGKVEAGAFGNVPKQFQPAFTARVGLNHGGIDGYTESDMEGGGFRAAVGAASYMALDLDEDNASTLRGTVDAVVKYSGFSTNAAVYVGSKQAGADFGDRALEATGLSVQSGHLITPHFEPVIRYGVVAAKAADDTHEVMGGLNVYFYNHALKWQNDIGTRLQRGKKDATHYVFESQLQFMF